MEFLIIIIMIVIFAFLFWLAIMGIKAQNAYKKKLTSETPVTDYTPTMKIGSYISADFDTKRWRPEVVKNAKVWSFADIVNATILVDGAASVHGFKTTVSTIVVRITMSHPDMKLIDISIMSNPNTSVNSFLYKQCINTAEEIISMINSILSERNAIPKSTTAKDVANELRELKGLLDDGIITQEEFDAKKSKVLNL